MALVPMANAKLLVTAGLLIFISASVAVAAVTVMTSSGRFCVIAYKLFLKALPLIAFAALSTTV
jgi:hypothetical protein